MWEPEINDTEAAALCAAWRSRGITSSHDLRALLTREARRRRWWIAAVRLNSVAKGRRQVA